MTRTPPPRITATDPEVAGVLSRTAEHLEGAYRLVCAAASSDLLSPWANTAMSIHLAAACLSRHLPGPPGAADHPDCLSALQAADTQLTHLPSSHHVPPPDLALIRTRLASALSEAQSLQENSPTPPTTPPITPSATGSPMGSAPAPDGAQS
jgi:hypothetical protein